MNHLPPDAEYFRILRSLSAEEIAMLKQLDKGFRVPRSRFAHLKVQEAKALNQGVTQECGRPA